MTIRQQPGETIPTLTVETIINEWLDLGRPYACILTPDEILAKIKDASENGEIDHRAAIDILRSARSPKLLPTSKAGIEHIVGQIKIAAGATASQRKSSRKNGRTMTNDDIHELIAELRAPSTIGPMRPLRNRAADALEDLKRDLDKLSGPDLSLSTAQNMLQTVLPWKMFYGDGKTLGEIAQHFNMSIYDFSPWLTAPATRIAMQAAEEASASREAAVERAASLEKVLRAVLAVHGFDGPASDAAIDTAYAVLAGQTPVGSAT